MFVEEIRRAVQACQRGRLPELSAAVWKGFAAGAVSEDEAQGLAELIEARKVVSTSPAAPRKPVGSRPRSSASLERRRAWTGSGWMPPAIAARFTMGEAAAIGVVVAEIAARGQCMLSIGAIAGRAGVCLTIVRNALRQARSLGLLHVEGACRKLRSRLQRRPGRSCFYASLTFDSPKQNPSIRFCSWTVQAPAKPNPFRSHSMASNPWMDRRAVWKL